MHIVVLLSVITLPLITTHNGDGKFQNYSLRCAVFPLSCHRTQQPYRGRNLHLPGYLIAPVGLRETKKFFAAGFLAPPHCRGD